MFDDVFGYGVPEMKNEFDFNEEFKFDEYENNLMEAPISKPYEFCDNIKEVKGKEK